MLTEGTAGGAAQDSRRLIGALADAVRATPGVAFLRPGLAARLRAAATASRTAPDRSAPDAASGATSALRVRGTGQRGARDGLSVEVFVVVHRGHRAVDVTRAVRASVTRAVRAALPEVTQVRVTVTVSGDV
ncbi:hypothetical protein RB200_23665 [Streptomyces sp. PmtG]